MPLFDPAGLAAPEAGAALRAVSAMLREADFDEYSAARAARAAGPGQLLGNAARHAYFADYAPPAAPDAAAYVLTSLFVLNRSLPDAWVDQALPAGLTDALQELSLLRRSGGSCRGSVSLSPYRGRWFLSDQLFRAAGPRDVAPVAGRGLVMPPHASSLLLLGVMDELAGSVLDAGTGTGFLALNAGSKADRAAGFDLNPRCVAFATANSAMNGSDVTFAEADAATWALPAAERFDHLVFNSPSLPRADGTDAELGHSTMEELLRMAVALAARVLRPGGSASVFGLVEVPEALAGAEPVVARWLAGAPVTDVTVSTHDFPPLSVSRRQLRSGRLHGQSLLVYGAGQGRRLLDALAARGTGAVEVVTIGFRTPGGPRPGSADR